MKKILLYLVLSVSISILYSSCSDFMDVDSTTTVGVNAAQADTVYPLFGVLAEFQKLAENYVVLGELRGDLMTTTSNADVYLRQIENFDVQSDNPYSDLTPYYSVINNCNIILDDTTKIGSTKFGNEFASAALIRAWTYLQLGINYKKAVYIKRPISTVSDLSLTKQAPIPFDELIDELIADVAKNVPNTSTIPGYVVKYSCPQSNFILGELYLWKGTLIQEKEREQGLADSLQTSKNYYQAAAGYYKAIIQNDGSNATDQNKFKLSPTFGGIAWTNIFSFTRSSTDLANEAMWTIIFDQASGNTNTLTNLFSNSYGQYKLKPSNYIINTWNLQKLSTGKIGDLRGQGSSWTMVDGVPVVQKYLYNKTEFSKNAEVYLARAGLVHLRYAEAINRCGKPMLALASLKYGLSKVNLTNYVPASEKTPVSALTNFDDARYDLARGVRGRVNIDPTTLVMPNFKWDATNPSKSKNDSINFAEDAILQEYALETAFEGNRWADCIRIAMHREHSGEFLYTLLAQKLTAGPIVNKLKDKANWYLPYPENN